MLILSKFLLLQLLVMRIIMLKVGPKELYKNLQHHRALWEAAALLLSIIHISTKASIWHKNMYTQILNICAYFCGQTLSAYIICSTMQTVSFKKQILSKDKYMSIFSHKIEAIVFIILQIFCNTHLKIFTNSSLFASWDVFSLLL